MDHLEVLEELARDRGPDLLAYATLLAGDRAAGQDLVQDAIVKVFGRLRTGFTPDVAEAYVRRTILTTYIDGYRRRRTRAALDHLVADDDARPSHESASADRVDLRAALGVLSRQERAVVVLRFYQDLTVADVADHMGLATGTVKRYLSNALAKLEPLLGEAVAAPADAVPVTSAGASGRPARATSRRLS